MSMTTTMAVVKYGAKAVYDAASAWMAGDRTKLIAMGFKIANLGEVYRVQVDAYGLMSEGEQRNDYAAATAELELIRIIGK